MANDTQDPARQFLGVGWAFPVCVGPDGAILEAAHEDDVRQSIRIILSTNPGERVMRPSFGAGLKDFVFETVNTSTMERMKDRVQRTLATWEPRIDLLSVAVATDAAERNRLLIDMTYRVRATNSRQNLVFPFYLMEGTTQ